MPICYWIPGLLGSELLYGQNFEGKLWVGIWAVVAGHFDALTLDVDGVSPDPRLGTDTKVGGILDQYYGPTHRQLQADLGPHGYTVTDFPFDWRLKTRDEGARLADIIRRDVTAADPCSIAAHSQGGLIARAVWANLLATNEQNKVRRIVTIGTPHLGSYGPVMVFSLKDEIVDQLSGANIPLSILDPLGLLGGPHRLNRVDVANVAASWPAFYELLPVVVPGLTEEPDPDRGRIFDVMNWRTKVKLSQKWMDYARQDFHPWLLSAASMPPYWVITTCAGTGIGTRYRVNDWKILGDPAAIADGQNGDGRVVPTSALYPDSPRYSAFASHSDEPALFDNNNFLANLILEVRNPPAPPPPPPADPPESTFEPGPLVRILQGPPLPLTFGPKLDD